MQYLLCVVMFVNDEKDNNNVIIQFSEAFVCHVTGLILPVIALIKFVLCIISM